MDLTAAPVGASAEVLPSLGARTWQNVYERGPIANERSPHPDGVDHSAIGILSVWLETPDVAAITECLIFGEALKGSAGEA